MNLYFYISHIVTTLMLYYSCVFLFSFFLSGKSQPQVTVNSTAITGRSIRVLGGFDQELFAGIPFADASRFQPPTPHILNGNSLDATSSAPACPQTGAGSISEACLNLDILRPIPVPNPGTSALPVMVWIYGGNFLNGQSSIYNASGLVAQSTARGTPTIFVGINYRTGPFGFPQGQEAEQRGVLNLGLRDMLAALTWVHFNIAAFGGDRDRVTVFGQSAGAVAIALLGLNSGLENLVHAAIFESGSHATIPCYNATMRETSWQAFVSATPECSSASSTNTFDCLQSADLSTLITSLGRTLGVGSQQFIFPPVIDGSIVPDLPSTLISSGRFSRIPFIAGTVQDEGTSFVSTNLGASTNDDLVALLQVRDIPFQNNPPSSFTEAAQNLVRLYPNDPSAGSPFGTGSETFGLNPLFKRMAAITGDFEYQALRRAWSANANRVGLSNYAYMFAVPDARDSRSPWLGISHASDIGYLHGGVWLDTSTSSSAKLASVMIMNYALSFAASLDPNDGRGLQGRPNWEGYENSNPRVMQMADSFSMVSDNFRQDQLLAINATPSVFAH